MLSVHYNCAHFALAQNAVSDDFGSAVKQIANIVFVYQYADESFSVSIDRQEVFTCLISPEEEFFNPVDEYLKIVLMEDTYLLFECSRNFPNSQNLLQELPDWDPNNFILGYRSGLLAAESTVSLDRGPHFRIDRLEGTFIIRQDSIEQGFY